MRLLALALSLQAAARGGEWFAGGMGGISTLSADAQIAGSPPRRISAYKPENGPAAHAFFGRHWNGYFSTQISQGWNRNSVLLTGADVVSSSSSELPVQFNAHSTILEAMLYFRGLESRARPYLAAGPGLSFMSTAPSGPLVNTGAAAPQFGPVSSTHVSFRVAVGIDLEIGRGLAFRYSFSETIQSNTLSKALNPRGQRNLANFQNWFGVCWRFR